VVDEEMVGAKMPMLLNAVYFGETSGPAFDVFVDAVLSKDTDEWNFFNTEASCAGDYGVTAPGISLIRDFDGEALPYSGELDANQF